MSLTSTLHNEIPPADPPFSFGRDVSGKIHLNTTVVENFTAKATLPEDYDSATKTYLPTKAAQVTPSITSKKLTPTEQARRICDNFTPLAIRAHDHISVDREDVVNKQPVEQAEPSITLEDGFWLSGKIEPTVDGNMKELVDDEGASSNLISKDNLRGEDSVIDETSPEGLMFSVPLNDTAILEPSDGEPMPDSNCGSLRKASPAAFLEYDNGGSPRSLAASSQHSLVAFKSFNNGIFAVGSKTLSSTTPAEATSPQSSVKSNASFQTAHEVMGNFRRTITASKYRTLIKEDGRLATFLWKDSRGNQINPEFNQYELNLHTVTPMQHNRPVLPKTNHETAGVLHDKEIPSSSFLLDDSDILQVSENIANALGTSGPKIGSGIGNDDEGENSDAEEQSFDARGKNFNGGGNEADWEENEPQQTPTHSEVPWHIRPLESPYISPPISNWTPVEESLNVMEAEAVLQKGEEEETGLLDEDDIQNDLLKDQAESDEYGTCTARLSNYAIYGVLCSNLSLEQTAEFQPIAATLNLTPKVMDANQIDRACDVLERKHASPAFVAQQGSAINSGSPAEVATDTNVPVGLRETEGKGPSPDRLRLYESSHDIPKASVTGKVDLEAHAEAVPIISPVATSAASMSQLVDSEPRRSSRIKRTPVVTYNTAIPVGTGLHTPSKYLAKHHKNVLRSDINKPKKTHGISIQDDKKLATKSRSSANAPWDMNTGTLMPSYGFASTSEVLHASLDALPLATAFKSWKVYDPRLPIPSSGTDTPTVPHAHAYADPPATALGNRPVYDPGIGAQSSVWPYATQIPVLRGHSSVSMHILANPHCSPYVAPHVSAPFISGSEEMVVTGSTRPSLVLKLHPHAFELRQLLQLIKGVVLSRLLDKLPSLADMIFTTHNRPDYVSIRVFAGIYSDPRQRVFNLQSWFYLQPVERPGGGSIVSCWAESKDQLIPIEAPFYTTHHYHQKSKHLARTDIKYKNWTSTFERCYPFSEMKNQMDMFALVNWYILLAAEQKNAKFEQYRVIYQQKLAEHLAVFLKKMRMFKSDKHSHAKDFFDYEEGAMIENFNSSKPWTFFSGASSLDNVSRKSIRGPYGQDSKRSRSAVSTTSSSSSPRGRLAKKIIVKSRSSSASSNHSSILSNSSDEIPFDAPIFEEPVKVNLLIKSAVLSAKQRELITTIQEKLIEYRNLGRRNDNVVHEDPDDLARMKVLAEELVPLNDERLRLGVSVLEV